MCPKLGHIGVLYKKTGPVSDNADRIGFIFVDGVLVQTLSIALLTLFYSLICIVLSIIPIIGYISFDAGWNPVILKLAENGYCAIHGIISISSSVISLFSPAKAMFAAFVLQWLIGTFIGFLILTVDSYFYNEPE